MTLKKTVCLTLLATLPLAGCIPVALVASATAGGAVIYDKRSFKEMNVDHKIIQQAQGIINNTPALAKDCHISLASYYGIVLMIGQAPTEALRKEAYNIVSKTPGVRRIYNEVTLSAPSSSMTRATDGWITTKIRTAMLTKPGLQSTDLKVVTENGIVYLMGNVSRKQADVATSVARNIDGVQKVVRVFEYLH